MARTYSKTALGKRLARYRKAAGYTTVEALAAAIPGHWISKGTITNIEVGRKADITIQELIALSRAIGVTPLALVCDLEQPFSKYKEQSFADTDVTGLAAQAPPFKAGVSRLYVSLVLYILLHDGEWGAAYGGDEVAVGPQGGDPAFE